VRSTVVAKARTLTDEEISGWRRRGLRYHPNNDVPCLPDNAYTDTPRLAVSLLSTTNLGVRAKEVVSQKPLMPYRQVTVYSVFSSQLFSRGFNGLLSEIRTSKHAWDGKNTIG